MNVDDIVEGCEDFEFERKFFVLPDTKVPYQTGSLVVQAYLFNGEEYSIRVRMVGRDSDLSAIEAGAIDLPQLCSNIGDDHSGYLTIKETDDHGYGIRYERELLLDAAVCRQLLSEVAATRPGSLVVKVRKSFVFEDGLCSWAWDVDRFLFQNAPLVIAECEQDGPIDDLLIPSFCFTEVTGDLRFSNLSLSTRPYSEWASEWHAEISQKGRSFLQGLGVNRFEKG